MDELTPGRPSGAAGTGPTTFWAYRFEADGSGAAIPENQVRAALAAPSGWVWLHFALADMRCRNWIVQNATVSEFAREVLLGPDEHVHLDVVGPEIMGVIPDLQRELGQEGESIARMRFVLSDRLLLSARRSPLHSVELTRRSIEAGQKFPEAVMMLDAIVDQFADAVSRRVQRFGEELDAIESRLLHEELGDERQQLGRVRLQSVHMRRQLGHLKTLFQRLEPRLGPEAQRTATALRALALKLDSIEHEMTAVYERARLLLDEVAGKMAALTNRRLYTLSVLTACLLPPTLVTGFFGMNTKDLPFQQTDGGTWFAFMIALGAAAFTFWVLRRLRAL